MLLACAGGVCFFHFPRCEPKLVVPTVGSDANDLPLWDASAVVRSPDRVNRAQNHFSVAADRISIRLTSKMPPQRQNHFMLCYLTISFGVFQCLSLLNSFH